MIFDLKKGGLSIFRTYFTPLTPHPTPPSKSQKSGFQVRGSRGVRTKTHQGMRVLNKIMSLQEVKQTIQPLEVGCANSPNKAPKRGGYVATWVIAVFKKKLRKLRFLSCPR